MLARMVELVDTRDLKSLGFTAVRVQVPLCAPQLNMKDVSFLTSFVIWSEESAARAHINQESLPLQTTYFEPAT